LKQTPEGLEVLDKIEKLESDQAQGVIATARNYLSFLRYIKDQDGDFSIKKAVLSDEPGTIFLLNTATSKDILKPYLTLALDIASQTMLSMKEDLKRRRYFILDEFGSLHPMNAIKELLTRGGGKGASVWVGIQDIGQIDEIYGENTRKTLVNSCGTKLILCVEEPDTKEYLSRMIGDVEVSEVNDTNSMGPDKHRDGKSISRSHKIKRLILPSELSNLPSMKGILKMPEYPYTVVKLPLIKHPQVNEQIILREEVYLSHLLKTTMKIEDTADVNKGNSGRNEPDENPPVSGEIDLD